VLPGSIAYSAVSQPLPLPCKNGGEPFSNEAVHITFVLPKDIRQLPYAFNAILFIISTCLKLYIKIPPFKKRLPYEQAL